MKLQKRTLNFLIFIASVLFGLFTCEFFARKLGLGNPLLYQSDNLIGYRLKPNQSNIRRKGAIVSTDYEGFRYNPNQILQAIPKYIVFVGDSVTYGGSYINDENLFSSIFCDISNKDFFCLNNGVNAWGVSNMARFIINYDLYSKRVPERFILVILPGDEERNLKTLQETPFWSNKPKQPSALNEIFKYLLQRYFIPNMQENKVSNSGIERSINLKKIQKNIIWDELSYLLEKSKHPIDIVITPPKNWFEDNTKKGEIKYYINKLKKIKNLKVINNTCNLYDSIYPIYEESLYVDGVHLSEKGHKVWAEKIEFCLRNN